MQTAVSDKLMTLFAVAGTTGIVVIIAVAVVLAIVLTRDKGN